MVDFNDSADGVAVRPTPAADSGLNLEWFAAPNPGGGIQGTIVKNDFLNDVWGSLKNLLAAAGITPERGNDDQVRDAINALAAALVNVHAAQISTVGIAGHLEVGTEAEIRSLFGTRAVIAQNLANAWRSGEQVGSTDNWPAADANFMGRWVQHPTLAKASALDTPLVVTEQWGVTDALASFGTPRTVTFPIPFATTNYSISGWFISPPFTGSATGGLPSSMQWGNLQAGSFEVESASAPDERFMWRAVGLAALQA